MSRKKILENTVVLAPFIFWIILICQSKAIYSGNDRIWCNDFLIGIVIGSTFAWCKNFWERWLKEEIIENELFFLIFFFICSLLVFAIAWMILFSEQLNKAGIKVNISALLFFSFSFSFWLTNIGIDVKFKNKITK